MEGFHWPDNWRKLGEQAAVDGEGEEVAADLEEEEEDEGQPLSVSGVGKVTKGFSVCPSFTILWTDWVLGLIAAHLCTSFLTWWENWTECLVPWPRGRHAELARV